MKLTIERINSVRSAMRPNSEAVDIECVMNEWQMFEALCLIAEQVTSEQFDEWIAKLRS